MVVLPAVSRMMVGDGRKEVAAHIAKGLRLVAFFAVPAFLILFILGTEFVSSVYQWGRFNQEAVSRKWTLLTTSSRQPSRP